MVSYKEIRASNALINDATSIRIAVFVGGTSGIGKITIEALVATGTSIRIYLIGRKSSQQRMETFIQKMQTINSEAELIWVEGEVSLLAETQRLCEIIKSKEQYIDLLFLTTGYAPFNGRHETPEGLEICQSLSYYSRMLFILQLLPLLTKGKAARVVSVFAGGMVERLGINLNDIDLKKPGNFSVIKAHPQYANMNTVFMDALATTNPDVAFIHSCPGWVDTGNVRRGLDPYSILAWIIWLFLEPLIHVFSFSDEESGQRYLFQSTSAAFGGQGIQWKGKIGANTQGKQENGLFLVSSKCDCTPNLKIVSALREKTQMKVVDHTKQVLGPYLESEVFNM